MMKKTILTIILVLAVAGAVQAATEAEKQTAINNGLAWLAGQQYADGHWLSWSNATDDNIGVTGGALLAFIEEGHTPTSGTAYSTNVANGLNYLFNNARSYAIGPQAAGNPDLNGNGIGVKFNYTASNHDGDIYATGLSLPPIAAVGTPGAVVTVGPQAGRTYGAVIQDTVEYLAYAQNEAGYVGDPKRGGWRYYANYSSSDNSTSQWPVVGLLYGQAAGGTIPAFVKPELRNWVNWIQNGDGGSDYDTGHAWGSNVSRTGTWILEADFIGTDPVMVTPADLTAAMNYLNGQWNTYANSTWNGNFGHPYAMWAAYKGLESTIGLGDTTTILNLPGMTTWRPGASIDPGDTWNWWESYCEYLVSTQAGGAWGGYSYWTSPLATAWYINILNATVIPPPNVIPAPGAIILAGIGVSVVGWLRRRRTL